MKQTLKQLNTILDSRKETNNLIHSCILLALTIYLSIGIMGSMFLFYTQKIVITPLDGLSIMSISFFTILLIRFGASRLLKMFP